MTNDFCAIGIDVGGTKIAAGVVTRAGKLPFHRRAPTGAERGGEAVLRDVEALSVELMNRAEEAGMKVAGVGLCVAELVDLEGNVMSGHTIKWDGWPIRERLSRIAPTVIESDVRAAALAEAIYGAGRSYEIFLYLTVGTGISCCLVMHKRPYAGAHGDALICASSPLTSTCAECGASNKVALEDYASGPALARRYQSYSPEKISLAEEVIKAAQSGDAQAVEIVRSAGDALGVTVGLLVNTLDPEAVVVGGGLGRADGLYWECFLRSTREHIWAETRRNLPVTHAALAWNGVIGAAINFLLRGDRRIPPPIANYTLPIDWQEERLKKALPARRWAMCNWRLAMPLRLCDLFRRSMNASGYSDVDQRARDRARRRRLSD